MSLVLSIVTVYRHSMREARYPSNLEEACISCRLYRDIQEDRAFMLEEIWSSEKDMQRHLKSDRYHTVLLVFEMATEPPEIRFDTIAHSSGIETIVKARNHTYMKGEKMNYNFKSNLAAFFSLFLLVIFFAGCVAAIPVIVYYYATDDGYVATADVDQNADEVWQAVTQLAEKRVAEGRISIVQKKGDPDMLLRVTDKIQTAEVKVISKKEGGSKIIIKADVPSESKEEEAKKEEELALRIMKNICEEAKADCKLEAQ
jgi:quinol monooxygenase YgiN